MIRPTSNKTLLVSTPCPVRFASQMREQRGKYLWMPAGAGRVEDLESVDKENPSIRQPSPSAWSQALQGAALVGVMFVAYFILFWFLRSCFTGMSQLELLHSLSILPSLAG